MDEVWIEEEILKLIGWHWWLNIEPLSHLAPMRFQKLKLLFGFYPFGNHIQL